tara:strand:+ start:194 stop:1450 length:1257 start_codon:yes stop_codon:yes gene_type:complete
MSILNKQFQLNLTSFAIYLYPIFLIFSPFLSNLVIGLVGFYGLMNIKSINFKILFRNQFVILFLLFWIYVSLRSLFSEYLFFSLKSSVLFVKYILFLFGFILVIKNKSNFLKNFTKILLILYFIVIFDALIQFFLGTNLIGYSAAEIENNRISGFFGDELILGSFIARLTFLLIALLLISKIKIDKKYIIFIIILSFITALISGERTALALNIISIIFYFILTNSIGIKFKFSILIIIASVFLGSIQYSEKINHRMEMTIRDLSSSKNFLMFTEGHGNHFQTAINLFKDNKIFGQGANMFRKKCGEEKFLVKPYGCSTHPHNMYLQLLAETGLIGFVFLFFLFFKICIYSLKHFYKKYFKNQFLLCEFEIALLTCMLINFWPILPSGNFFSSSFGNIAILPIVFLFLNNRFKNINFLK